MLPLSAYEMSFRSPTRAAAIASVLAIWLLGLAGALPQARGAQSFEHRGVIVDHPTEWGHVAQRLAPWLRERIAPFEQKRPEELVLQIHRGRDLILKEIAHDLGIRQPWPTMERFLQQMIRLMGRAVSALPDPKHVRLWKRHDLIAHLDAGHSLPGYRYDRQTNRVTFGFDLTSGGAKRVARPGVVPIVLTQATDIALLAEAQNKIDRLMHGVENMLPELAISTLCSTARVGIRQELQIHVPGDMWLVEGTSNYLAYALLKRQFCRFMGCDFSAAPDTRPYMDMRSCVGLASWSERGQDTSAAEPRLQSARVAFATSEATRLVQRHGRGAIAKVLAELKNAASETENRDGPASAPRSPVPEAIRKVTGEDIRARLATYGTD